MRMREDENEMFDTEDDYEEDFDADSDVNDEEEYVHVEWAGFI